MLVSGWGMVNKRGRGIPAFEFCHFLFSDGVETGVVERTVSIVSFFEEGKGSYDVNA